MSTHSFIGKQEGNKIHFIFCKWDGYPSNNGKILLKHYQDEEKVNRLINLGYLSHLGAEIGIKIPFENPYLFTDENKFFQEEERRKAQCIAYMRDCGDSPEHVQAKIVSRNNLYKKVVINNQWWGDWGGGEWFYLWRNGRWHVSEILVNRKFNFVPLSRENTLPKNQERKFEKNISLSK